MVSRNLLLSASLIAFAAGTGSAQTTTTGTNESTVIRSGNFNVATVEQIGDFNVSRIVQTGEFNEAVHRQRGSRNRAASDQAGNDHRSTIGQQGSGNSGSVVQANGNRNISEIDQGTSSAANDGGAPIDANRNAAEVTQRGSDNESIVRQRDMGNTAPGTEVSDNRATVIQGTAEVRSNGAFSLIQQESRGNIAEMFQFEGAFPTPDGSAPINNGGFIIQRHLGAVNTADPTAATFSNNRGSIAMRGYGNAAGILQNGRDNNAEVTVLGGGTATGARIDPETQRSQGNTSLVDQSGTGLTALAVGGSIRPSEGQGNFSNVQQRGNNHRGEIWQRGIFDTNLISQTNGADTAAYSDGAAPRAFASVSQLGLRNSSSVTQGGDNFAEVTQGLGTRSSVTVNQNDAGDFAAGARAQNKVGIAQYGDNQVATVNQNSLGASATVFQQAGPASGRSNNNNVLVEQGTGATAAAGSFSQSFFSSNPQAGGTQTGANSRNLVANVTQGNGAASVSFNQAEIRQDGTGLAATVNQAGSGTSALPNRVRIAQQGSGNSAAATQHAGAGPSGSDAAANPASGQSGDEFFFGGGARSAEIVILQTNSGNMASAEQRGRGQLARIEQSGARNRATIVQEAAATNATAVIRQSGNDNSYTARQTEAGQYLVVSQTGNNNAVTNLVQRGPGS